MKQLMIDLAQATLFVAITFAPLWFYLYNMKP